MACFLHKHNTQMSPRSFYSQTTLFNLLLCGHPDGSGLSLKEESTRCVPLGLKLCRAFPYMGIKSNSTEASFHTGWPSRPHFLPPGAPLVHAAPRLLPGTLHASLDSGPSQLLTLLPADADTGNLWNVCQILH